MLNRIPMAYVDDPVYTAYREILDDPATERIYVRLTVHHTVDLQPGGKVAVAKNNTCPPIMLIILERRAVFGYPPHDKTFCLLCKPDPFYYP